MSIFINGMQLPKDEVAVIIYSDGDVRTEDWTKYSAIEVPDETQPVRWIPVKERLPEEYKDVLCYYEYFRFGDFNCMFRTIDRGYYGNGIWGGEAGQGIKNKVLAWMPLPKPPEECET